MIAICPSCHDAVHHGALTIDDETLYRWKKAGKGPRKADLLFVEPGRAPLLKLGQTAITGRGDGLVILAPSVYTQLAYRVEGGDMTLVSCEVADKFGNPIIRVVDNRVSLLDENSYQYGRVPGHFALSGPASAVLDDWMIAGVKSRLPGFGDSPEVLLEAEVVAAGQVAVRGIWRYDDKVIVVRDEGWVIPRSAEAAMLWTGAGTIHWLNPIDLGLFQTDLKLW